LARGAQTGTRPTVAEAVADFHVGYLGTAVLALCFVVLGAGVMFGKGLAFPESAVAFSKQVIDLYAAALGEWSRPVIGASAFAVMFSTTLTVVDGFPRGLAVLSRRLRGPEQPHTADDAQPGFRRAYWLSLAALCLGSLLILALLVGRLKALVDVATTLSFLTAPCLAWLNHRAITSPQVPAEARPGPALRRFSALCNAVLLVFAVGYVWLLWLA
jgi:amino acid transporter